MKSVWKFLLTLFLFALCLPLYAETPEFQQECRHAGGVPQEYNCVCPDGSHIYANHERCLEKPWTPDELRAKCDEYHADVSAENRLAPEQLELFAKDQTSASGLFEKMKTSETWKPFLENYVLQEASQSDEREAVDADHPRRIKFHRGLIIASTAHPKLPGLNNFVQMFEADPKLGWRPAAITFENGEMKFDRNPTTCTTCHGNPPRPNWAAYRIWPGTINHRGRYFVKIDIHKRDKKELEIATQLLLGLREKGYQIHPQHIQELLADHTRTSSKRALAPEYAVLEPESKFGEDSAAFNSFLNHWNFQIIANRLKAAPDYAKLQYALLGNIFECGDIPGFLGEPDTEFRKAHEHVLKETYADILKEVRSTNETRMKGKIDRAVAVGSNDTERSSQNQDIDVNRAAGLRYLFEGKGVNVKNFSLDYKPGAKTHGYEFNEFGGEDGGLRGLACLFMADVIETDLVNLKEVGAMSPKAYVSDSKSHIKKIACDALRAKSLEVITGKKIEPRVPPKVEAAQPPAPALPTH